jgi:hypothetical protein
MLFSDQLNDINKYVTEIHETHKSDTMSSNDPVTSHSMHPGCGENGPENTNTSYQDHMYHTITPVLRQLLDPTYDEDYLDSTPT